MKRNKKQRGITLVALIITIIVLLILAVVAIRVVQGDGIIAHAKRAKFVTEVSNLQEQIVLKYINDQGALKFGAIDDILGIQTNYNEKLFVENGKLVYNESSFTTQEKEWLESLGLVSQGEYYIIVSNSSKSNYSGENVGTLAEFCQLVNSGDFNYEVAYLVENIDLSKEGNIYFEPIGTENHPFDRKIYGNNYEISNINMNISQVAGLFGYVQDARIMNLTISGEISSDGENRCGGIVAIVLAGNDMTIIDNCTNKAKVTDLRESDYTQVGGIVGNTEGKLIISNCSNEGQITAYNHAAGIIARVNGNTQINNCNNSANITSFKEKSIGTGGITGSVRPAIECQIQKCSNTGTINSSWHAGGISGTVSGDVSLEKCYNSGIVISDGIVAGGVVGLVSGNLNLNKCYNKGNIRLNTENYAAGGIIAYVYEDGNASINNCYNAGTIDYNQRSNAGICGRVYTSGKVEINNCYNIGKIISTNESGIVGSMGAGSECRVQNCYYLKDDEHNGVAWPSDLSITGEAIAKSRIEMISPDFIELLNRGNSSIIWKQDSNGTKNNYYPILIDV